MAYLKCLILLVVILLASCSDKSAKPQSKTEFFEEHNKMLQENKERVQAILSDDFQFQGLEFIYVDFGKVYYSWWGHALIRFVGSGATPNEDWTLSFIADFNDYELDNLKAYFGGYEVLTVMKPLRDYMDEYIKGESREMLRYPIVATREQELKFLLIIRDWIKDAKKAGAYTFRQNNCSGLMMKALYKSGISSIEDFETYPFDMPIQFHMDNIIYLPPLKLTYEDNQNLDGSLYRPCQKDCHYYSKMAENYYPKKQIEKYYDFKKQKTNMSLDFYLVRLFWWAKKLTKLLID